MPGSSRNDAEVDYLYGIIERMCAVLRLPSPDLRTALKIGTSARKERQNRTLDAWVRRPEEPPPAPGANRFQDLCACGRGKRCERVPPRCGVLEDGPILPNRGP